MINDITLYEIPLGGNNGNAIQKIDLGTSLVSLDGNFVVDTAWGYIFENGLLRFIQGRLLKNVAAAGLIRIGITNPLFNMITGFANEYPTGYATMNNTGVAGVALKCFFDNSGSRLGISPAVAPSFNKNMPAGTYNFSFGIWFSNQ